MAASDTPLTSFLIAVSESPDLLERYQDEKQRAGLLAERRLADHPAFSSELSLEELQAHISTEHPDEANVRLSGIKLPKLPSWILKAPTKDDPDKPQPPPPPKDPRDPP